jgi:hypothetical protein
MIGSRKDNVAQNRLAMLYHEKARAQWKCAYPYPLGAEGDPPARADDAAERSRDNVVLCYFVLSASTDRDSADAAGSSTSSSTGSSTGSSTVSEALITHTSSELLDLQSNVVLAVQEDGDQKKSLMGRDTNKLRSIIETFLVQFNWMRQLASVLGTLNASGHFSYYPSYSQSLSVALSEQVSLNCRIIVLLPTPFMIIFGKHKRTSNRWCWRRRRSCRSG